MNDEEKKAKRAAYMRQYKNNLSRVQKEKRRLKMQEYNTIRNTNLTPQQLEEKKEKNRLYYEQNKKVILFKKLEYRINNKDRDKAYQADYRRKKKESNIEGSTYYQENRERLLAKRAEYREKYKDEIKAYQAEYRKKQKEKKESC
jgi:hypothetical protein